MADWGDGELYNPKYFDGINWVSVMPGVVQGAKLGLKITGRNLTTITQHVYIYIVFRKPDSSLSYAYHSGPLSLQPGSSRTFEKQIVADMLGTWEAAATMHMNGTIVTQWGYNAIASVEPAPPPDGVPPDEEEKDWKKWLPVIIAAGLALVIIIQRR